MERANQKLKALLVLWNEKRGKRVMPARAELAVSALKPWLGNLALIELNNGKGATFRLCGTNLRDRFGGEMTGRQLEALEDGVAETLRNAIRSLGKTCAPIQIKHKQLKNAPTVYYELCLPLAEDGQHLDTVLFASYAEQKR